MVFFITVIFFPLFIYPNKLEPRDVKTRWQELDSFSPHDASFGAYLHTIGGLNTPLGVAVNGTDHIYIADRGNERVAVYNKDRVFQYAIGTGYGTGNYEFKYPIAIGINNDTGQIYVADRENHRVQVFDNTGTYQFTIGETGVYGPENSRFYFPSGVAVNATGYVYIADLQNHRVQVFNSSGNYEYTIGVTGVWGTDDNLLNGPSGVAINASGYVYITEYGTHRVKIFNDAGNYQYIIGPPDGMSGSDNDHFKWPSAAAINASGIVYIIDEGNHRVQVFDSAGIYQRTIGVTGVSGLDNSHFNWPHGAAVNATGQLFIADTENNRVQILDCVVSPPVGLSIVINGGASEIGSTSVILTLTASGATEMCFSNDGTTYSDWEPFSTSKHWELDSHPGLKTVFFKTRDESIESEPVFNTITLILPPAGIAISINSGATDTATLYVTLSLTALGAAEICFSNNGTTFTDWETYTTTKNWKLDGGPGLKTVFFKPRNSTFVGTTLSASIYYTLPPTNLSIIINAGAINTTTTTVTLTLSAIGATRMCFSNDGITWSPWEPFTTTKEWFLAGDAGLKIVFFKTSNGTIESTEITHSSITLIINDYSSALVGAMIIAVLIIVITLLVGVSIYQTQKRERRQ